MLGKLVHSLRRHTLDASSVTQPRKSARLNPQKDASSTAAERRGVHDSGTESDDDELETINNLSAQQHYRDQLDSAPPALSASPPDELDCESWDSVDRESGIAAGYDDSDYSNDSKPVAFDCDKKKGAFHRTSFTKEECEFPLSLAGENKRRYSESCDLEESPISSRLRSNYDTPRERDIITAARRTPVKVLINKPYTRSAPLRRDEPGPLAKRHRASVLRPSLDLEKMREHILKHEPCSDDEDDDIEALRAEWSLPAQSGGCVQPGCAFRPLSLDD